MRRRNPFIASAVICAGLALSSCDAAVEDAGDSSPTSEATDEASAENSSTVTFSETGWLVVGQDGAVYTTMLDSDGTYRDFRNGEALYTGEWEKRNDDEVCFTPQEEGLAGDCWTLGSTESDGTVRATDSNDRAVDLRKISYVGPGEDGGENGGAADQE